MQLSEPMPRIPKIVSKLALVLLIIQISGSRVVIKSILQFSEPGNRIHKIVSKLALVLLLNTSKRFQTVINVYSAVFGPYHPYSKIISYQMLPNTYTRFQSVLKPYSTTSGTRLCVPIPHPNSSYTKRGASLAPLNFVSTHMFQIVFFSFSFRICQPVCKYQFPAVWSPIFPVLIFGFIIIRERLPFPLF